MEYQIQYHWPRIGPGTFSVAEQVLRLRGYTAARRRWRILWIMAVIWVTLWEVIESQVLIYLGLPPHGKIWPFVAVSVECAPIVVGFFLLRLWPCSTSVEEFEKRSVTRIGRQGKKISFDVPNPFKPGKFLYVGFKAKSTAEADQIVEALLEGQEINNSVIIPPDVESDIRSGQLSKQDIMIKYAIRAEELEEMYKMLAEKR